MKLPEYFEFLCRTKVIFGNGTLKETGKQAVALGAKKAFIVHDPIVKDLGLLEPMKTAIEGDEVDVVGMFSEIPPNSEVTLVKKGYEQAKKAKADVLVVIGGGSAIDTAKCMNILLTEGGDLMADHQGTYLLQRPLMPMIAIPTTAGTGSEMSFAAVIKDAAQKLKISFVSPYLAPNVAVLDPEVVSTMPPKLAAMTAMDALTHCIESLHSINHQPVSDALALHGIRMISENIRESCANGKNLEARGNMLIAANIAGLAFSQAWVGIVHAIAHALGGYCNVPHGLANAIILPYGMEYNMDYAAAQYAHAARAWGMDIERGKEGDAVRQLIETLKSLLTELQIPAKLRDAGVKEEDLAKVAEDSMMDGSMYNNPREAAQEDVEAILKKAF